MRPPILYVIHYSPWSIRARWALDHHGIGYEVREHIPMLGEASLRLQARRAGIKGQATVPMLLTTDGGIGDSWKIMCHADRIGSGPSLMTADPYVASWASRLEPAYDVGRKRLTRRILNSPEALRETAAVTLPDWMAGFASPLAALGARFIARKYDFNAKAQENLSVLTGALDEIRKSLGKNSTLGITFSAADIVAACLIGSFAPHASVSVGPAIREVWTHGELLSNYNDLVCWRDELVAKFGTF